MNRWRVTLDNDKTTRSFFFQSIEFIFSLPNEQERHGADVQFYREDQSFFIDVRTIKIGACDKKNSLVITANVQ